MLPPTLLCSPPCSTWTWIASIDIIDAFHLGLPCICSYHHIPYALRIDVQQSLHILLSQFTFDLSNVIAWHVFLLFPFWCLSFPQRGGEKGHQETCAHLHRYMGGD